MSRAGREAFNEMLRDVAFYPTQFNKAVLLTDGLLRNDGVQEITWSNSSRGRFTFPHRWPSEKGRRWKHTTIIPKFLRGCFEMYRIESSVPISLRLLAPSFIQLAGPRGRTPQSRWNIASRTGS